MHKFLRVLPLLTLPLSAYAADTVTLTVSGHLYKSTVCNVTAASDTIALGDIVSSRINGSEYQTPLGVTLTCTDRNGIQNVNVKVIGTGTTTNKLPVTGDARGFYLALKRGSAAQNFSENIRMDTDGPLNLSLTPERNTDAWADGDFSASVTIEVTVT